METMTFLQHYWWLVISLLGALLVFLLFVQGGQSLIYGIGKTDEERTMLVNALGRKWETTFTTLVTFGGAFFASFPLFYSTSFGGAFYVWMLILFVFVIQAVAYEFRSKPHNVFGRKTYDLFLMLNGIAGPLLLGVAVATLFTGAHFTVNRLNIADLGGNTSISQWTTPWHGLEAVADPRNLALGLAVVFLSGTLGCQYFLNAVEDATLALRARRTMRTYAVLFLVFFLAFFVSLLFADGYAADPATGTISVEPRKYLHNLLEMPYVTAVLLAGVLSLLWSVVEGWRGNRKAIWFGGFGTVLAVLGLLLCAGWNRTAYYPSLADMQSSLTIANSSSSEFTLKVMSFVSLAIPVVLAYIWYAWRSLSRPPITREEMQSDDHKY
ncbi:cytochrome d ubiquinol oxidase subunit II [Alistipes sp.]|uniref:cytochrome d ubiquinol oxidase subunit II n=1 Tax=Alistipes sp. TaxID=1872444 RepID=UPI0025C1A00F|nr:cytochrome d ubiquinol oxidase subunit II [Alistipes sp.]